MKLEKRLEERLHLGDIRQISAACCDLQKDAMKDEFCLSKINSTEPYAIRALCLKQAYAMCRFYPELMAELKNQIELMEYGELSPGLLSVIRRIKKII